MYFDPGTWSLVFQAVIALFLAVPLYLKSSREAIVGFFRRLFRRG
jgi:hypothetical protein